MLRLVPQIAVSTPQKPSLRLLFTAQKPSQRPLVMPRNCAFTSWLLKPSKRSERVSAPCTAGSPPPPQPPNNPPRPRTASHTRQMNQLLRDSRFHYPSLCHHKEQTISSSRQRCSALPFKGISPAHLGRTPIAVSHGLANLLFNVVDWYQDSR